MRRTILMVILCLGWAGANAGTYSGGAGTAENPYTIGNAADWRELTAATADWNGAFVLTADIDLAGVALTPVGTDLVRFGGIYDGKGHIVRNATIHLPDGDFVGLFGGLSSGGKIVNLGVENATIQGRNFVGGLAGFLDTLGSIATCYATGSVHGTGDIGGLVGGNVGSVTGCYAKDSVSGDHVVGGLVGSNSGSVDSCYSMGPVSGIAGDIGGLAGSNDGGITASFWDLQASGQTTSAGGTGKTTAEMRTLATFTAAGWDFVGETANGMADVWRLCVDGAGYPRLAWEYSVQGDFDCPSGVALEDLLYLSDRWLGTTRETCGAADGNLDGRIDLSDLGILAENWKKGIAGGLILPRPVVLFSRASVAYIDGVEKAANVRRSKTVALVGTTDGAIPAAAGEGGEHVKVMCKNATYLFGIGVTSSRLYRSSDGVTWSRTVYTATVNGGLFSLANGNLISFNTNTLKVFYSSNNGDSFTEGGYDTARTAGSSVSTWGMAQNGNTLIAVEYGSAKILGGRYIYRSVDGGANWTKVADLANQTPNGYHWHTVAYHSATGRWVAFFGDTQPNRGAVYSADDGVTWSNLYVAGNYMDQPIVCVDVGDPTRLLTGFDGPTCIGWVNVTTGELEGVNISSDARSSKYYCFALGKHDGVYYAGGFDNSGWSPEPVIWVSNDLVNWSVYHKFGLMDSVKGCQQFIGYFGGKLHFLLQTARPGILRSFSISPATIRNVNGILIEPAVTNLANTVNLSSFETSNPWSAASLNWTVEKYATPYVGSYGLRMYGRDADTRTTASASPNMILGDASTTKQYIIQCRMKATRPIGCMIRLYRNNGSVGYVDTSSESVFVIDKNWKHIRSYPFMLAAGDAGNFKVFLVFTQGPLAAEVFMDSFQVQEIPITEWQVGGTAKAADVLTETITTPIAWTDIFSVQTVGLRSHYETAANLYIKTWKTGTDNSIRLYYNGSNLRFYLQRTIAGVAQAAAVSSMQEWHPNQIIKFALRADGSGLALSLQNGRGIETITDGIAAAELSSPITMIYGDASSAGQFPGIYVDGTMAGASAAGVGFFPLRLTDGDVAAAFNLTVIAVAPGADG